MGNFAYFPLVSGLLRSYAETFPEIKASYEFMPFLYMMDLPQKILNQYTDPPDIAAFSSVMWNEQLNYFISEQIKKKYPNCLIVFGGPNVPMPPQHSIHEWMDKHRQVDIAVRAEGEEPFVEILKRYRNGEDFSDIPGVAFRNSNGVHFCDKPRNFQRDMEYPSPYLEGLYDDLLKTNLQFQAIIETNRGCPFPCVFCYWGRGGLSRKFRYRDMDKVFAEIDWMGKNKIKYVFNADSNFGMNDRDQTIADFIVETKKKYGFPEKFRTCFGKNTDEKIFKIGSTFHQNQLEKGITLARQSNDLDTLKNVRRNNIKMSTYVSLQQRFNDLDIPVYCELILGLPGETKETWIKGVDEILEAGTKNQLFIYLCQVFANTEMAENEYKEKHGIKTQRIKLAEIHGQTRPNDFIQEYEDIIIQTNSMLLDDWKSSLKFSYILMLFHSLKLTYYLMIFLLDQYGLKMSSFIEYVAELKNKKYSIISKELSFYDELIDRMLKDGEHRGTILPDYGVIYWDVEEASFLRITQNTTDFYKEIQKILKDYLTENNVSYDESILQQVLDYQKARIPQQQNISYQHLDRLEFDHNFAEYFDKRFSSNPVMLNKKHTWMELENQFINCNSEEFARMSILWGRKSGTMLIKHTYGDK